MAGELLFHPFFLRIPTQCNNVTLGRKRVNRAFGRLHLWLANCYEGRYYRQIAPRKGEASPFLSGPGDSETIGAAKRTATKSAHTA